MKEVVSYICLNIWYAQSGLDKEISSPCMCVYKRVDMRNYDVSIGNLAYGLGAALRVNVSCVKM